MPFGFLAPAGLLAALAVAVPIAIHLLQRRREETRDFPAVRFLLIAQRRSARRLRLRRLLLLAVRCLGILLLALALARPVLDAPGAGAGGAGRTVVILDSSLSMAAGEAGRTSLGEARAFAAAAAGEAGPGARFALVAAAALPGGDAAARWEDREGFLAALERVRPVPAVAEPGPAFAAAYRLLAEPGGGRGEILVVTDLARGGWEGFSLGSVAGVDARVPVRVARVGVAPAANRAGILSVAARGESLVAGEARELSAEILNNGPEEAVPVELWVDETLASTRIETIPPGAVGRSVFALRLPGGGAHRAELRLPADGYAPDDRRALGLAALPPVEVLVVDGEPGASLPQGETFFLQEALRPDRLAPTRSIRVRVAGPEVLGGAPPAGTAVVVLANVPAPEPGAARRLADFVADGGGLAVFWGRQSSAAPWAGAAGALLPAAVAGTDPAPPGGRFRVGELDYDAPPLAVFRPPGGGTFATAGFGARARIVAPGSAARVLARFADGAPWIVERSLGAGRTLLVGSTADLEWSDLPTRPVYVPLVQRLVLWLAGSLERAEDTETVAGGERVFTAGAAQAGAEVAVIAPDGSRTEVRLRPEGSGARAVFRDTAALGLYSWSRPGASGVFAVNAPREESDLARLPDAELARGFAPVRPEIVEVAPGSVEGSVRRRGARSLERPILLLLLAALLLEAVLAAPRRTAGERAGGGGRRRVG